MSATERDDAADERDRVAGLRESAADQREAHLDELEERVLRRQTYATDATRRAEERASVDEMLDRSAAAIDRGRALLGREAASDAREAQRGQDEQSDIDQEVQRTSTR